MWRVMMIGVRLTVILCMAEAVLLAETRQAFRSPFAPYEAIMPGQPSDALESYPCNISRDDASMVFCTFSLKEGPFSSVSIQYDHIIERIGFTVRSDRLHLSDLILCWGAPTSVEPDYRLNEIGRNDVHWGKQVFANVITDQNDISRRYLLPIYYVSIDGDWRSCESS